MNSAAKTRPDTEGPDLRFPTSPVAFAIFVCLVALGVRFWLPGSDPFQNYFQRYVRSGTQGRNRTLPARIAQMGPHAAEEIAKILIGENSSVPELSAAARLAGVTGDKALTPLLARLAENRNELEVRVAALESLGRLGGSIGSAFLEKALSDPEPAIRTATLQVIGAPIPAAHLLRLSELARGSALPDERAEAVAALARAGGAAGRRAVWEIYNAPTSPSDVLAAKKALLASPAPAAREEAALAQIARGYYPLPYSFPGSRARRRLEARLRTLLFFRVEDLLVDSEERGECGNAEECHERHLYYRDLLRRKTTLELEAETFSPLLVASDDKAAGEPLIFVRSVWLLGGRAREAALSMVRLAGPDPAIFPIIELGFDTFSKTEDASAEAALSALGEVVRLNGQLRSRNLEVEVARPVAGILQTERFRFEGGIFVPAGEGE